MMKKIYFSFLLLIVLFLWNLTLKAQIPELMYFKFNSTSSGTVANDAATSTRVSSSGALLSTLTTGGQFGSALLGNGTATTTNGLNANWPLNLSGPWTISMWFSGVSTVSTASSINYVLGTKF